MIQALIKHGEIAAAMVSAHDPHTVKVYLKSNDQPLRLNFGSDEKAQDFVRLCQEAWVDHPCIKVSG